VFLENIISARSKASDTVAPESAAALLKEAGFGMAACGFAQAFANGKDGVEDTLSALSRQGISALGIRSAEDPGKPEVKTVNGVRVSFLQYTSGIPSKTRKNMERDETSGMVPEAEIDLISEEIDSARAQGAEAVIVLLNWGKTGKDPDKAQRELAELIAQAGADLIIGNGSHVPQSAEYLSGRDGGSVLCVWSLGSLLSGDRSNVRRMSGYLFHVTVKSNGQGGADILNPEYTPVYTWKYKQDGRWYYRCIASDTETPDGMDNEQRKMMNKAAETVETMLKDSPLTERGAGHAD
jgi:poly-gamma-glutamate synthesis protein (capsule biosynthesis protein)